MFNCYTALLRRGNHPRLKMIPKGAHGVWRDEPAVVLLDGGLVRQNIEKRHGDMSWLFFDIDKIDRLAQKLEKGMVNLDMPVYNFTGDGEFEDMAIEQGRHRTYLLMESFGVDYLPVLIPAPLAPKFRRLFGYRNGYLTQAFHHNECQLKVVYGNATWYIGTDIERESVEFFRSEDDATEALRAGQWHQRPSVHDYSRCNKRQHMKIAKAHQQAGSRISL